MWVCPICGEVIGISETAGPHIALRAADIPNHHLDSHHTTPALIRALHQRWLEPEAAAAIVRAIGRVGGDTAREALLDALGHESLVVRTAAAECLQARARMAS